MSNIFIKIIFLFPIVFIWQHFLLPWIVEFFRDSVKRASEKMKEKDIEFIKESDFNEEEKRQKINEIRYEGGSEIHTKYRKRKLGFITQIVGWSEIIFFVVLIFFLLGDSSLKIEKLSLFFQILGGWIFVKTIVHYDQWAKKREGKAYFYISLFGTFLNIIFGVGIAILLFCFHL